MDYTENYKLWLFTDTSDKVLSESDDNRHCENYEGSYFPRSYRCHGNKESRHLLHLFLCREPDFFPRGDTTLLQSDHKHRPSRDHGAPRLLEQSKEQVGVVEIGTASECQRRED